MKFNLLGFLFVHSLTVEAFIPSATRLGLSNTAVDRNPLQIRYSTAVAEQKQEWIDLHDFNVVLDELAEKSGNFNQRVISMASECEDLWESVTHDENAKITPDTISFNTVLKAWNRCCNTLSESNRGHKNLPADTKHTVDVYTPRDAAKRATTLLLQQEKEDAAKPDTTSFNIVIDAWAKSRVDEAPEAAERLLKLMLDNDLLEPDTFSYHGVLDAWANSARDDSLEKVEQIFHHMEGLHADGKNVKVSIRTVNSVLNAYSKRASVYGAYATKDVEKAIEVAESALAFFREINSKYADKEESDLKPDVTSYTTLMDVFARVGTFKASVQAEKLLQELKEEYEKSNDPRLRPNFRSYTALITAWARCRSDQSAAKVEALLKEMNQNPATMANSRSYTSAIQCWGRSRDPLKAKHALKILREMQTKYKETGNEDVRPNIISYNAAIDACATCPGTMEQQTEAIKIAFAILKAIEVDDAASPTQITYATLLKAVSFLLPAGKERNKVASAVFEKAKNAGLVEFGTLKNLRKSVDAEVMTLLMEGRVDQNGNFDYNNLPAAWTKNVVIR